MNHYTIVNWKVGENVQKTVLKYLDHLYSSPYYLPCQNLILLHLNKITREKKLNFNLEEMYLKP